MQGIIIKMEINKLKCFCQGNPIWKKICYECQEKKRNYNRGFMAGLRLKKYEKRIVRIERKLIKLELSRKEGE